MSRMLALYEFLTGEPPARKTPPLERRVLPDHGLNETEKDSRNMSVAETFDKDQARAPRINFLRPLVEVVQPGRVNVTPALARRILDEANYTRQRNVTPASLLKAERLVTGNDWIDGSQIWFASIGRELFLIDGQHRLSAVWSTGVTRGFQVQILACETLDEVHQHYSRLDRFGRKRTDMEMLNALDIPEALGVGKLTAKAAWKAMPYLASDFSRGRHGQTGALPTDAEKTAYLAQWAGLVKQYDGLISLAEADLKRALINPGIMAMALLTLRDQPTKAAEFWEGAAMDDGLRRGDARHTLVTALRTRNFHGDGLGLGAVSTAAVAWNAFFEGRKLTLIKYYENTPIRIAGVRRAK